eukprot:TRINITY_DN1098_c0_g1_i2.p1 TRINITY_DN1098_c0_g1~~TRINITY_DN1098_c0_g1_i2.p1  ORF type:complete len:348 (+),score=44.62 TRINITY_DN1098_c0_g1_i2:42-1085(+)
MSGTIALFCLLTIGFVFARRHHDEYGYGHDEYNRGHRFGHSSYGYYRDAPTYRKLKQESRYNDYEETEYYLKKVYGDRDDHGYGEEHEEKYEEHVEEAPQYDQTQQTYTKVVLDAQGLPVVDPAAAAVDGTVVVEPFTVVAPAVPVAIVDPAVPAVPALPVVIDDNPVGLPTEDSKIVIVQEVADVATPDLLPVTPDVPQADAPVVVVVVVDANTDIPAVVDTLAQLIQNGDAGAVTAQQVDTPVLDVPPASLAIAVPTITLPADNVVTDTLITRDLLPVDVATPDVATVPTKMAFSFRDFAGKGGQGSNAAVTNGESLKEKVAEVKASTQKQTKKWAKKNKKNHDE